MDIFSDPELSEALPPVLTAPPVNRVRVYLLAESGSWSAIGVGAISIVSGAVRIVFEDDALAPFEVSVILSEPWKLETGSIIQVERNGAPDVAFSFQAPAAAEPVWREVLSLLQAAPLMTGVGGDGRGGGGGGYRSDMYGNGSSSMDVESSALTSTLPPAAIVPEPMLENLGDVLAAMRALASKSNLDGYDRLTALLLQGDLVRRLYLGIFPEAEARRDDAALRVLNLIAWEILQTQHSEVLHLLLCDTLFEQVLGVFEYDTLVPSTALHKRYRFRRYLRRHVAFRQAVTITDADFLASVHTLWRISFLHDVLGPLCREDSPISQWLLTSLSCAESDIVFRVSRNKTLLRETYSIVSARAPASRLASAGGASAPAPQESFGPYFSESEDSSDGEEESARAADARAAAAAPRSAQHDAIAFLAEFIRWTRSSTVPVRINMYQTLQEGEGATTPSILLVLNAVLSDPAASYVELSLALEIVYAFVNFDPKPMRDFVFSLSTHPSPPPAPRTADDEAAFTVLNDIEAIGMGLQVTPPRFASSDDGAGGAGMADARIRPHERNTSATTDGRVQSRFEHGSYVVPPQSGNLFGGSILHSLVWRIVDDPDARVQGLAVDILRSLLDVTVAPPSNETAVFLELAFSRYLPWLCTPFTHMPPTLELPRPVNSMKNLDSMLQEFAPTSEADSTARSPELHSNLRARSHSVRMLVVAPLQAEPGTERPSDVCGSESAASKSSKQYIADLIVDLAARHPILTKALVHKLELFSSTPRLCLYAEKHLMLLGIKLLRCFAGMKDTTIALCV